MTDPATPPSADPAPTSPPAPPATLDLEALRQFVARRRLADDVDDAAKLLEAELQARDEWAAALLTTLGTPTVPLFAPEPAVRVATCGGVVVAQVDGVRLEDVADVVRAALRERWPDQAAAQTPRGLQPLNVTVAGTLWTKRLPEVPQEDAVALLKQTELADLVQESFNTQSLSARVREALDQVHQLDEELRLVPADAATGERLGAERARLAALLDRLGAAFSITTSTTVRVTKATKSVSRSTRAARTLKTLED